jgi:hypothetical protein
LIKALPKLRLLVTTGMRNSSVDMVACRAQGIDVCGAPGDPKSTGATAELAWSLLLALFKQIPKEAANMQQGLWQTTMPPTLEAKRLGLVGAGHLGQCVGRVGLAFGMEVVAWSPNLTEERAAKAGVKLVSKQELFATSDAISVHMVLSDRSRGIVDAASLQTMKVRWQLDQWTSGAAPTGLIAATGMGAPSIERGISDPSARNSAPRGTAAEPEMRPSPPLPALICASPGGMALCATSRLGGSM